MRTERTVSFKLGSNRQAQDLALAEAVLLALPLADREIITRYYVDHQTIENIERDLGLDAGYVLKLRAVIRSRYYAERRAGAA